MFYNIILDMNTKSNETELIRMCELYKTKISKQKSEIDDHENNSKKQLLLGIFSTIMYSIINVLLRIKTTWYTGTISIIKSIRLGIFSIPSLKFFISNSNFSFISSIDKTLSSKEERDIFKFTISSFKKFKFCSLDLLYFVYS